MKRELPSFMLGGSFFFRLKPKLSQEAKERMSEGGKNKGSQKSDTLKKPERTDEKLGGIAGVGNNQYSPSLKSDEGKRKTGRACGC